MKGLIPDPIERIGLGPTLPDPRIRAVEKEQTLDAFGMLPGIDLDDVGGHVVAHDTKLFESQAIGQGMKVIDQGLNQATRRIGEDRLFRLPESPEVGYNYIEGFRQG